VAIGYPPAFAAAGAAGGASGGRNVALSVNLINSPPACADDSAVVDTMSIERLK